MLHIFSVQQPQFGGLPEPAVFELTIVQQRLFGYLSAQGKS